MEIVADNGKLSDNDIRSLSFCDSQRFSTMGNQKVENTPSQPASAEKYIILFLIGNSVCIPKSINSN